MSLSSFAQVPPPAWRYSCTAQNARGFTFSGQGWHIGGAQSNALANCANSPATAYAANCHIVGCTRVAYAPPAPVVPVAPPPPPAAPYYTCTAWGWHHQVYGVATGYNLSKVQWKAVRNCARNGGVNCAVTNCQ